MDRLLWILAALVLSIVLYRYFFMPVPNSQQRISLSALEAEVALLESGEANYLILSVPGTDHFLNVSGELGCLEVDLPQILPWQIDLEDRFSSVLLANGIPPYESKGSDGSRFIDGTITGPTAQMTAVLSRIFQQTFDVAPGSDVVVEKPFKLETYQ
ncbi:MAG: hypothetical protein AAFV69_00675 [Pseudomonadota bacterium]